MACWEKIQVDISLKVRFTHWYVTGDCSICEGGVSKTIRTKDHGGGDFRCGNSTHRDWKWRRSGGNLVRKYHILSAYGSGWCDTGKMTLRNAHVGGRQRFTMNRAEEYSNPEYYNKLSHGRLFSNQMPIDPWWWGAEFGLASLLRK